MAKEAQTPKKDGNYLWVFTREQQEQIETITKDADFAHIFKMADTTAAVFYTPKGRKKSKSVFVTSSGLLHDSNNAKSEDFGGFIDESKLTLKEYKEKFPFENVGFASLSIPGTSIGNIDFDFQKNETTVDKKNKVEVLKVLKNENGLTEKEIAKRAGLTPDAVWTVALQMDDPNAGYSIDVNDKKQYFLCQNGAIYVTPVSNKHRGDVKIVGVPENPEYQLIKVSQIKPSRTNPRRRFNDESLAELAENIKKNGLINPITVRFRDWQPELTEFGKYSAILHKGKPNWLINHLGKKTIEDAQHWCDENRYEIVAGERRWRASVIAGLETIPVIVKELSDEQVLEIQIHENLHREEVHPLDEAFAYEHLMKTLNITQEELALRVGKPEKFVRTRLKLNSLIAEAQEDLEANRITIKMALEIAKFDQKVQPKVLNCAFGQRWQNGEWVPDKEDRRTFGNFLGKVSEKVLLELSCAKFDLTDTTLRKDCLACVNCPERTGAKDSLFDELKDDEDQCLNASCFNEKTNQHIRNLYAKANAEEIKNGADSTYKMRIIAWFSSNQGSLNDIFRTAVLVDGDYKTVSKGCKNIEKGIYLDSNDRFGKIINLCANKSCKAHWSGSSSSSDSNKGKDETEAKKERLERKQYLLDVRVGEPTRVEVLKLAANQFSIYNADSETVRTDGEYFAESLVRWLKLQNSRNEMTAKVIADIIREWCGDIPEISTYDFDFEKWLNFLNRQREKVLAGVYFLLVHGHKGEMFYETKKDQSEIVAIAEKYNVNYELVYAQNLVKKCAEDKQYKKFLDAAKVYLQAIERGEKIDRPVFFKVE